MMQIYEDDEKKVGHIASSLVACCTDILVDKNIYELVIFYTVLDIHL